MQMKKNKKILDDVRHSDLYIKQYDRKIKSSRTEIHIKNPGAAAFYFYKVQFERSADIFL